MKNQLKLAFGLLFLVALLTNVSAFNFHHNRYAPGVDDGIILVIQNSEHYDLHEVENENRYPLYDYRGGYSYRFSDEYQDEKIAREISNKNYLDYNYNSYENDYFPYSSRYYDDDYFPHQDVPNIKYIYNDHMRSYSEIECYNLPPRDKLIYRKC